MALRLPLQESGGRGGQRNGPGHLSAFELMGAARQNDCKTLPFVRSLRSTALPFFIPSEHQSLFNFSRILCAVDLGRVTGDSNTGGLASW